MRILHIAALLLVTVLSSTGAGAQTGEPPKSTNAFAFRHGQSVYVTAFHTIDHSAARRNAGVGPSPLIDNHLPAEFRIRRDFEERGVYKLVNKASEADFVFLVLIDDSAAEGLALAPRAFADHQNPLDMSVLREAAYARSIIGPLKLHNLGRISDRLVKRFHDEEGRPAKNSL